MLIILLKILILVFLFIFPTKTHAIVVLPGIILVPLVKLIAVIVGAFSVPLTSMGFLIGKITKKYKSMFIISLLLILLIGVFAAIILKILYPNNPWF